MKARVAMFAATLFACSLAVYAAWFFQGPAVPIPPGGWTTELRGGRTSVNVWQAVGTAEAAAAEREAAYVSDGWTPAPVCTPTFKLLLRGHDMAAILAEELPGGTTVTELLRRGVL